jgi:hypothetical protein
MRAAIILAVLSCLVGCVAPARTSKAYLDKGRTSAATSLSAVRSAELAVEDLERDGLFPPQLSIILSDAADEASAAESTFSSIQPPDPSLDHYRSELGAVLGQATDVLEQMRIDARRTDDGGVVGHATTLPTIAQNLERFAGSNA